nr:tyrosine-type recombinase/integrase [Marinicella sp. W31]MDC2877438.1 tyrosine-type recombinase/integrase [Marinicella sp. W31]
MADKAKGREAISGPSSSRVFIKGETDRLHKVVVAPTRNPRKLPDVLSVEDAARLVEAALGVAYGAGLRVCEVAHLKADDIDSTRMLIRVEQDKGRKDRNALLSPQLLELLRQWWREGRRRGVMLPQNT